MAFTNKIRLPFKLTRPQFPEDRTVYRKANGETKVLSSVVKKTYEGETDWWPEKWHQRLAIALGHDNITIEGDKYLGGVVKDGDYEIDWQPFLDYPTAKAKFSIQTTPFDNTNSNCMSCEEASQLSLEDNTFGDPLEEDQEYNINVADNDNICCYPAIFSISSFDSDYLESANIDQEGNIVIQTKDSFISANGIKLLTYRVTCPNGRFDEADVFANLEGSEPGCIAPSNPIISSITTSSCNINFTASPSIPDHYFWRLYRADSPGAPVQSGSSATSVSLTSLDSGTSYKWYVRSQCAPGNDDSDASNFIEADFTTNPDTSLCGKYSLSFSNPTLGPGASRSATYLDCIGSYQTTVILNNISKEVCALQTTPGTPVEITFSGGSGMDLIGFSYLEPC